MTNKRRAFALGDLIKARWLLLTVLSIAMTVSTVNSYAVENGILLSEDENAVYLLDGSPNAFLYKPQIAFTTAHSNEEWGKGDVFVNTSSGTRIKVHKILIAKGFKERLVSQQAIAEGKAVASRSNDFAVLVLEEPIPMTRPVELIRADQLSEIILNQEPVYSTGYSYFDSNRVRDQRPRRLEAIMIDKESARQIYDNYYSVYHPNFGPRGATYELIDIQISHSKTKGSICDGDSGSGFFILRGNTKVYLGPVGAHSVGTPNCGQPGSWGEYGNAFAIEPVYKHLDLIREAELIVNQMLIKAAEMKAKQEADAKATAEAEAKVRAEVEAKEKAVASKKKKIITCVKGKMTKKVKAIRPKCPTGYKKK